MLAKYLDNAGYDSVVSLHVLSAECGGNTLSDLLPVFVCWSSQDAGPVQKLQAKTTSASKAPLLYLSLLWASYQAQIAAVRDGKAGD